MTSARQTRLGVFWATESPGFIPYRRPEYLGGSTCPALVEDPCLDGIGVVKQPLYLYDRILDFIRSEAPGPGGLLSGRVVELDDVELFVYIPDIAQADRIQIFSTTWTGLEHADSAALDFGS